MRARSDYSGHAACFFSTSRNLSHFHARAAVKRVLVFCWQLFVYQVSSWTNILLSHFTTSVIQFEFLIIWILCWDWNRSIAITRYPVNDVLSKWYTHGFFGLSKNSWIKGVNFSIETFENPEYAWPEGDESPSLVYAKGFKMGLG